MGMEKVPSGYRVGHALSECEPVMNLQTILLILFVLFLLFFLVTAPVQLANTLEDIGGFLQDAAHSLVRFFHALRGD
jgi:hypothetical protein